MMIGFRHNFRQILQVIGKVERAALQAVSYVGCGISIMCLSVTVIFFLWQGYYQ